MPNQEGTGLRYRGPEKKVDSDRKSDILKTRIEIVKF